MPNVTHAGKAPARLNIAAKRGGMMRRLLAASALTMLSPVSAYAQQVLIFDGSEDDQWITEENWSDITRGTEIPIVALPGASSQVTIDNGRHVQLNGANVTILDLRVGSKDSSRFTGTGELTIGGATLNSQGGFIGYIAGADGRVNVGGGGRWTMPFGLAVGHSGGKGQLHISGGGVVSANEDNDPANAAGNLTQVGHGAGSEGLIRVQGTGSRLSTKEMRVGTNGQGTLEILSGGTVSSTRATLANSAGSTGIVRISGTGSNWTLGGAVEVGNGGPGRIVIEDTGLLSTPGAIFLNSGSLNIGGTATTGAFAPGTVSALRINFQSSAADLVFNHTANDYLFGTPLTSGGANRGTIHHLSGVTRLTGNSGDFRGTTEIDGGRLIVDGLLGGNINMTGGTLAGSGQLTGTVTVGAADISPGNSPGTLSVAGNLALSSGTILNFELGSPSGTAGIDSDLITVGGNLTLDGTLRVIDAGGFGNGLYRLFNYGGSLTDNGLGLGTIPAGYLADNLTVQTGVAGQVNLLVGAAAAGATNFWDGPGNAANGVVDGGSGTWNATATNWTTAGGDTNGVYAIGSTLIFAGTGGMVTIDSGGTGTLESGVGLQFAADGYVLSGNDLSLDATMTDIRVGDGSAAGANYRATIAANLTGLVRVRKTDLGTLVLTGKGNQLDRLSVVDGMVEIRDSGDTRTGNGEIDGSSMASDPHVLVSGAQDAGQSAWRNSANLSVGINNKGRLTISDGALVTNNDSFVGSATGAEGHVAVAGFNADAQVNATWITQNELRIGVGGIGVLDVGAGGTVQSRSAFVGREANSTGTVTVAGANATWQNLSAMNVGFRGSGSLSVSDGGRVMTNFAALGQNMGSFGEATVSGAGSSLTSTSGLNVGVGGTGLLTIADGGTVDAGFELQLSGFAGSAGTLNIGAAAGDAAAAAGILIAPTIRFGDGDGRLVFNHINSDYVFASTLINDGVVTHLAGTTTLTGNSANFTGSTGVSGGTLIVNGALGGAINVSAGVLGGSGSLTGAVVIGDDGRVNPGNSPGTLTIGGSFSLSSGSALDFELGSPTGTAGVDSDLINVGGDLTLDGTLNVTNVGGFGAGLYRLINYSGALTDNGLDIGLTPMGFAVSDLAVQTAMTGQINLLVAPPAPSSFTFWDGADLNPFSPNGVVDGGSGTWTAAAPNWTTFDGEAIGVFDPAGLLTFASLPGTVTVDNSSGAIALTTGMQFASDGYIVTGDDIRLDGDVVVRVGDGTSTGIGMGAVIAARLTGAGGLNKTDLGTLTLTGANSYAGGTTISSGVLVGNATSLQGDIVNNAALIFDQGSDGTYAGRISGTGNVGKIGGGRLTLSGGSSYGGNTNIIGGTLAIVDGATLANGNGFIGGAASVLISGSGSAWTNRINLSVGSDGNGTLSVTNGGQLTSGEAFVGTSVSASGTVSVAGTGSGWANSGTIRVGAGQGAGTLWITGGAAVSANVGSIANGMGSSGSATISGAGSTWTSASDMFVGDRGAGTLTIADGGSVANTRGIVGAVQGASGTATVTGANSLWTNSGNVIAGGTGTGRITIAGGARITAANGFIGLDAGSSGMVSVSGAGSTWAGSGNLTVGNSGMGALTLSDGGRVDIAGELRLARFAGSSGTFNIGGAAGGQAAATGQLDAASVQFGPGSGILNFNHLDTAYDFAPGIAGQGVINHLAGTTLLIGDSSGFGGATNLLGGRLFVQNRLGGVVQIGGGALLGGTGTVGSITVNSGGVIAPGNSIGSLNVGDIGFNRGAIYRVEVNGAGQSDHINASGTATINGGTVVVDSSAGIAIGTRYTILTAAGGRSGTFASLSTNLASTLFLAPSLSYDATHAYLSIDQHAAFDSVALTANQGAAARGADSLGQGNGLWDAVAGLTDAATARGAFDGISGEIHASAKTTLIEDSRFVREATLRRLATADGAGVWGQGLGSWSDWSGDGNAARAERSAGGWLMGVDAPVAEAFRLGLTVGYSHTKVKAQARASTGSADSWHLGAYGGGSWGAFGLRVGGAMAWHNIDTRRAIGFAGFSDSPSASYRARTHQLFAELGYRLDLGAATVEPIAAIAHVSHRTRGFAETGGASALSADRQNASATFTTLGARFDAGLSETWRLRGLAGWRHAFGDRLPDSVQTFAGGDAFTVTGVPISKDVFAVDAGIDARFSRRMTLGLSYGGQFGSGYSDQNVRANLTVRF